MRTGAAASVGGKRSAACVGYGASGEWSVSTPLRGYKSGQRAKSGIVESSEAIGSLMPRLSRSVADNRPLGGVGISIGEMERGNLPTASRPAPSGWPDLP